MNPFYSVESPAILSNRAGAFSFPDDGWCHLVPKGEFPHKESGVVQVFDDEAFDAMIRNFRTEEQKPNFPGIRGDFDHFSYDNDKSTEASCWIQDVQKRENGLWGRLKLTTKGRAGAEGGDYRLLSPTFRPAECSILENRAMTNGAGEKETRPLRVRPLRLDSIAFCNNPNLAGMVPISNRGEAPPQNPAAETKINRMKKVCDELGLSQDAAEDAIHAEVKKLKNRAQQADMAHEALKNRCASLEADNTSLLKNQVESDLTVYANRIPKGWEEKVKGMLLENRASNIEWLKGLPEIKTPGAPAPIHNRNADLSDIARRNGASDPSAIAAAANQTPDETPESRARARTIRNRASQILAMSIKNRQGKQYDRCWKEAESEIDSKMAAAN